MVSTRKKRQSNKRLLSQLDDFDQDMINGNTANERQESVEVNEGTNDRDFTVGTSNVSSLINENVLNVKTLERCFNERIDREMCNIVDTVEDRIQNAILTAIDNIVSPKIELAIRSIMHPLDGMWPVRLETQNVGNMRGLMPLLKTHLKTTEH